MSFDVEGSKTTTNSNSTKAVASNLSGNNITIKTRNNLNNQTNISGSNLEAKENLTIDTKELNVVSSEDTLTVSSKEKDISGSVSMTMYGAASGPQVSLGYGQSNSENSRISNNNSQLNAKNITTKTTEDTNIKGANVNASELLSMIVGGDLNVESQKDTYNAYQKGFNVSAGFGLGTNKTDNTQVGLRTSNGKVTSANAGYGASNGRTKVKQTVLTSLTGKEVDIQVDKNTNLKGSLLAAGEYDKNGNFKDNKNLNLATETLTYQNSTNRVYDSSKSFNVGVGLGFGEKVDEKTKEKKDTTTLTTANLSYNNSNTYSKSKTLATLGEGNVTIKDKENSDDTTVLNRDVTKTNKDIYSAKTDVKADMTLDGRLLSEDGRKDIKNDIVTATAITNAIEQIATTEKGKVTDFFSEVQKNVNVYEGMKQELANNPELAKQLQDPDLKPAQKQAMLQKVANIVRASLGYTISDNDLKLLSTDKTGANGTDFKGHYNNKTSFVNDKNSKSTSELLIATGHETQHNMDDQDNTHIAQNKDQNTYATNFGKDLSYYTSNALDYTNGGSLASTNKHNNGQVTSTSSVFNDNTLLDNNKQFANLDAKNGDDLINYAIGAGMGALLDLGIQKYQIYKGTRDKIDWTSVGISATAGATGVGLTNLVGKAGTVLGGSTTTKVAGEITADTAVSIGTNIAKGQEVTVTGTAAEVLLGQSGGNAASKYAKTTMENTKAIKSLDRDIARKQKLIDSRKTTRKDARKQQKEQLEIVRNNKIDSVSTKAGIVGGASTSTAGTEAINTLNANNEKE